MTVNQAMQKDMFVNSNSAPAHSSMHLDLPRQELHPGVYSVGFKLTEQTATAAQHPVTAQHSDLVESSTVPIGDNHPIRRSLTQPSPRLERPDSISGSDAQCCGTLSISGSDAQCCGTLIQHPWRDAMLADILASGRSAPIPADADACVSDGFDAAVTEVLQALTEAVRVRCQCIDEQEPPPEGVGQAAQQAELGAEVASDAAGARSAAVQHVN